VRHDLPFGTVTFLFTDVEGSTKLLHELGATGYAEALAEHRRALRHAFTAHGGVEVDTQGDAFFVAFPTAPGALAAAAQALDELAAGPIRVRVGVHTGTPHVAAEGYVGHDVHKAARIAAAGHGGQVLLSKDTRDLVEGDFGDLGEHRLKDFAEPIPIFQLGTEAFPPLKTISNTNLPCPASSFVGRDREVDELTALLTNGARLVTLTGPGGSGKTRLAIEAAAELVPEFKAGVFWVGLAPLRDAALVSETIGRSLGAKDGLAEHIGERELLVLLDNLEQVIASAPELASLVERCPNLRLLVTSRELLRVRGEREYPVPPLAEREAVELFCARARAEPDESVRALCRALDHLPLALELAAARASVLSPEQILERLSGRLDVLRGGRDADPRQQTLRATIEWSHELLSSEEQRLFALLGAFRGGCTLVAAEEVIGADLDMLQALVDKNLLRHANDRFWMLETVRDYAAERLEASGEAGAVSERHAEFFLRFAQEARGYARGPRQIEWLDRTQLELDNIRSALSWAIQSGQSVLGLTLVEALEPFWYRRLRLREGLRWLEQLLELTPDAPPGVRAGALALAGRLASELGWPDRAKPWYEESLPLARAVGDRAQEAWALHGLGFVSALAGEGQRARELLEQSFQLFLELGDHAPAAGRLTYLAWLAQQEGDLAGARSYLERSIAEYERAGDESGVVGSITGLGDLALEERDWAGARERYAAALERASERQDLMYLYGGLAAVAAVVGRPKDAARLWGAAQRVESELDQGLDARQKAQYELVLGELDADEVVAGRASPVDEARALGLDVAQAGAIPESGGRRLGRLSRNSRGRRKRRRWRRSNR
jgi:predicted ATPase